MIKFLNEAIRAEFHLLPIDRQKELTDSAEHFEGRGMDVTVLYVDRIDTKVSEITIRIDQKFITSAG